MNFKLKKKINYFYEKRFLFHSKFCMKTLLAFALLTYFINLIFKAKSLKLRPSNNEYLKHILQASSTTHHPALENISH